MAEAPLDRAVVAVTEVVGDRAGAAVEALAGAGLAVVDSSQLTEVRMLASLSQVLVENFVNDGHGDVHGPHLAEPEVWARLDELELFAGLSQENGGSNG